ncbi:MAG: hypothetical protein JWN46_825, partial [Acidimicrobiales bacterium]|nr:hypothetical protein [Acidimicrobiales bacterium]
AHASDEARAGAQAFRAGEPPPWASGAS